MSNNIKFSVIIERNNPSERENCEIKDNVIKKGNFTLEEDAIKYFNQAQEEYEGVRVVEFCSKSPRLQLFCQCPNNITIFLHQLY